MARRQVDGGDICGLSLTAAKFGPGIVIGPGPTAPASDAFPRPFVEKEAPEVTGARVVLSARQLRVSQRISQAAMRRAKALSRRLGRGLTGGDIRPGTITRDVLALGLAIVAATPVPNLPGRPGRSFRPAPESLRGSSSRRRSSSPTSASPKQPCGGRPSCATSCGPVSRRRTPRPHHHRRESRTGPHPLGRARQAVP